jgi:hypothetical protein
VELTVGAGDGLMGLLDLITDAYDRSLRPWPAAAWRLGVAWGEDDRGMDDEAGLVGAAVWWADECLACARRGDYPGAWEAAGDACACEVELLASDHWQEVCKRLALAPTWEALLDACELAERIDSLLGVLERGAGARLARDCRGELGLLPVLADWCDDGAAPAAAAEARHLSGLLRSRGVR